jgi:hypothetical protein
VLGEIVNEGVPSSTIIASCSLFFSKPEEVKRGVSSEKLSLWVFHFGLEFLFLLTHFFLYVFFSFLVFCEP